MISLVRFMDQQFGFVCSGGLTFHGSLNFHSERRQLSSPRSGSTFLGSCWPAICLPSFRQIEAIKFGNSNCFDSWNSNLALFCSGGLASWFPSRFYNWDNGNVGRPRGLDFGKFWQALCLPCFRQIEVIKFGESISLDSWTGNLTLFCSLV